MEDISQLELVAYLIIISKKIKEYKDKTIEKYIELLEAEMINTKRNYVLNKISLSLIRDFQFGAALNHEEAINYAILIFKYLLNYFHRDFDEVDVVINTKIIYGCFSVRTAKEEVAKLNIITNK